MIKDSLSYLGYFGSDEISTTKGLVAHYTMDENDFNENTYRVSDKSSNENHGTNSGATFTEDRFGKEGGAMSFDGNTVNIPHSNVLKESVKDSFTISAWVKSNVEGGQYGIFSIGNGYPYG